MSRVIYLEETITVTATRRAIIADESSSVIEVPNPQQLVERAKVLLGHRRAPKAVPPRLLLTGPAVEVA